MGKSSHKSKKRRRAHSNENLIGLEEKLSRLIDVLTRNEVIDPLTPSTSFSEASFSAFQGPQSKEILDKDVLNQRGFSLGRKFYGNACESGKAERSAGVYDIAESVFAKYRRHDGTTFSNLVGITQGIFFRGGRL